MLPKIDETRTDTFSERRELAASEAGRKALLMDFIAVLHGKIMDGEMTDSNMIRAIQTAEKLHRTLSEPAIAPVASPQIQDEEDDPFAYDHTNMHKEIAEMSDADVLSYVDRLVGTVEQKSASAGQPRTRRSELMQTSAFSGLGETVPAPAKARKRGRD